MGWLESLLATAAALFAGLNIFQLVTFRANKKKARAEAEKYEAEAAEHKQSALERRLAALEQMYADQGTVIDGLRKDVLKLSSEKFANEKRIVQLEAENKMLKEKVAYLEKEVTRHKGMPKK